jgi:hypothetical protein
MKKLIYYILSLFTLNTFALDRDECDLDSPIDTHVISTPEGDVPTIVCKSGQDLILVTDQPVSRKHLLYGGLNIGMPYLGMGLTYSELKNERQDFHISANIEGSLGSNGISVQYGKHPFGNLFFYGASGRVYQGLPGEKGFDLGPTVGLSGGSKRITGFVSLSFMSGYNTRMDSATFNPEVSMGLRIRLFKK